MRRANRLTSGKFFTFLKEVMSFGKVRSKFPDFRMSRYKKAGAGWVRDTPKEDLGC